MTLSNNDINIFFHMRNHYKKVNKAKSTFILSPNLARVKSNSSLSETHRKMVEFEKKHFQNQQHFPLYDDRSASLTCLYHTATLGDPTIARVKRPTTRRHANDIPPHRENLKPRSYSAGRIPRLKTKQIRKSNSSKKCYSDLDSRETSSSLSSQRSNKATKNKKSVNSPSRKSTKKNGSWSAHSDTIEEKNTNDCVISPAISPAKKIHIGDNAKSNKIEEHEYLLFLLGVTEDIILNNYYTNEDIERVFREHTELNIDRLSKEKMEQHLIKLADELHISEAQANNLAENQSTYLKHDPSYTNIQTLKTYTCDCTPDIPLELYSYPSNDYNYYSNSYQNNLDEIIYYRHSLGRVTECTEPSSSTTLTKEISSCPTRSDITLLENLQFDDPNRKLYETRSEVINLKNNVSEDNLHPLKILRNTLSENIVPQKAENINKDSLDKEKWQLNNNQTITVIEENHSCDEDKDCDTEKEQIKKNLEKYKNHKSSSDDIRSNVDTATSNEKFRNQTSRSKFNTETSNANTDKEDSDKSVANTAKPKRNKVHQRKTNSNSNTEYSGFATDNNAESSDVNTEKIDDTLDKINQRLKTRPHTKRSKFSNEKKSKKETSCSSDINTDVSDLNSDRTDFKAEIGDHNDEQNMSNTDKSIADNGDYKPEEKEKDGFNKYFHLEQINLPVEVNNCNLQLDLTFAKDSLENLAPSPYTTSKSNDMSEADLQREESKIDVKDNDISVQTSYHKLEDKPEMENKYTQITYSCSNKACCTDDDEPVNNNDYILINHPIYVLKSALNSNKNIILEKTNFLSTEETELQLEDDTEKFNKLDLKLLGSDYDLTPERDTTDKYNYQMSDASTTTSHVQIPSLSSIQEESLLLGNLYDLHDGSSQEFDMNNDLQLGSATYRCIDNPKALSCDDEIFLRNSEVVVNKNWFSDKSDVEKRSPKKRVSKFKHIRSNVNVSNSTSSASLTC